MGARVRECARAGVRLRTCIRLCVFISICILTELLGVARGEMAATGSTYDYLQTFQNVLLVCTTGGQPWPSG